MKNKFCKIKPKKVKQYCDYLDEAVKRGDITKIDAEFYKKQNKSGKNSGAGGVFHGTIK